MAEKLIEMPYLALDLDGTVVNFFQRLIECSPDNHGLPAHWSGQTTYEMADRRPYEELKNHGDFWLTMEPHERLTFRPRAYITSRPIPEMVSVEWLHRHDMPVAPVYRAHTKAEGKAIVARMLGVTAMVDDDPAAVEALNAGGMRGYLIKRPWNETYWHAFPRVLDNLNDVLTHEWKPCHW